MAILNQPAGSRKAAILGLLGLCLPAVPAAAQQNTPNAAPAPITGPDNTSARFGDWLLRCNAAPGGKQCEMVQTVQIQIASGQQAPVALFAIGRASRGEPLKFIVQLPSNVTLASGIIVETKPDRPVAGAYTRCLPVGCFAEALLTDDIRRRWMARTEAGQVRIQDGANQAVALPLSFRGFSLAMEALMREMP